MCERIGVFVCMCGCVGVSVEHVYGWVGVCVCTCVCMCVCVHCVAHLGKFEDVLLSIENSKGAIWLPLANISRMHPSLCLERNETQVTTYTVAAKNRI